MTLDLRNNEAGEYLGRAEVPDQHVSPSAEGVQDLGRPLAIQVENLSRTY
jgi:hypothetical protein